MAVGLATAIVALDVATQSEALSMAARLREACRFFKVGSELFTAAGPGVVEALRAAGDDVFLDLKFHDIPNTVRGAVRSAVASGASMVTVHASGGRRMLEAAMEGAAGRCRIMGVTVLTSLGGREVGEAWGRQDAVSLAAEVLRLGDMAQAAGLHGLVCSGEEVALVRARFGDRLAALVPGIRFTEGTRDDQARVVTPEAAVAAGARYLVLGRAVTGAADPLRAMERVNASILSSAGASTP